MNLTIKHYVVDFSDTETYILLTTTSNKIKQYIEYYSIRLLRRNKPVALVNQTSSRNHTSTAHWQPF
jgi:hypothetical protein